MPITSSVPIKQFDQPSFHAVDEVVTGIAFDVHNEFGRYLDERLYQTELDERFAASFCKHHFVNTVRTQQSSKYRMMVTKS